MIRKLSTLAVIPLFLAACEPAEDEPVFEDDPAVAEERAHDVGDTETLNLSEVDDSGVAGDVRFTVLSENQTEVMVEVQDAQPNTSYHASIHQGTCDTVGQERHDLGAVETNEAGDGVSTTTLNTRLVNVMDGNHVVALHGARAERDTDTDMDLDPTDDDRTDADAGTDRDMQATAGDRPVACGEISEHGTALGW